MASSDEHNENENPDTDPTGDPPPPRVRCDRCHCPIEVGRFISMAYRRVCAVCWDMYHNKRFGENHNYWSLDRED
jgi:hypothetical protein